MLKYLTEGNNMKKTMLYTAVFAILSSPAFCSNDAETLKQGLINFDKRFSLVDVFDGGNNLTISFPETTILKQQLDADGKIKNITETIPAYKSNAVKNGLFQGNDVYEITSSSVNELLSYLYNKHNMSNVNAKSILSKVKFVPNLHFIKSLNVDVQGMVLTSTDIRTGLKNEVGGVKKISFKSDINQSADKITYNALWYGQDISYNMMIFKLFVPEITNRISAIFENNDKIDYSKIPLDSTSMQKSQSFLKLNNAELEIIGIPVKANIVVANNAHVGENSKTISLVGKFDVTDINTQFASQNVPYEIKTKYILSNIDREKADYLQKLQKQLKDTQKSKTSIQPTSEETSLKKSCAAAAEDVVKDIKLRLQADIKYKNADAKLLGAFIQSNGYIVGKADIIVHNFDVLYPDYTKECEKEMSQPHDSNTIPEICAKNNISMAYRKYIDFSKRTTDADGQTVDKIEVIANENGIFINNNKIKDAIKIDFGNK